MEGQKAAIEAYGRQTGATILAYYTEVESGKLAEELKNQYVLGFTSRNDSSSGKWRSLKVNVTAPAGQPKFTLRYKPRYFVPKAG